MRECEQVFETKYSNQLKGNAEILLAFIMPKTSKQSRKNGQQKNRKRANGKPSGNKKNKRANGKPNGDKKMKKI